MADSDDLFSLLPDELRGRGQGLLNRRILCKDGLGGWLWMTYLRFLHYPYLFFQPLFLLIIWQGETMPSPELFRELFLRQLAFWATARATASAALVGAGKG
jgi:hypothetical protein